MSKQSSLFGFVSRGGSNIETNTVNTSKDAAPNPPAKSGKFKYIKPKTKGTTDATANSIGYDNNNGKRVQTVDLTNIVIPKVLPSTAPAKKDDSFIEIIDDSNSPIKTPLETKKELSEWESNDDFFNELEDDVTFTKVPSTTKTAITLDDLYAKYGTPEKESSQKTLSSKEPFDIDKALKSNSNYRQATEKLGDCLQKLQKSPVGKFKFAAKSSKTSTITLSGATNDSINSSNDSFLRANFETPTITKKSTEPISSKPFTSTNGNQFKTPSLLHSPPLVNSHPKSNAL